MKKLTLLLVPVLPGFGAWAVNGFTERPCDTADSDRRPDPIPSRVLKRLLNGFTIPTGDTVFVSYTALAPFISTLASSSAGVAIQPLDRGGLLISTELASEELLACEDYVEKGQLDTCDPE